MKQKELYDAVNKALTIAKAGRRAYPTPSIAAVVTKLESALRHAHQHAAALEASVSAPAEAASEQDDDSGAPPGDSADEN